MERPAQFAQLLLDVGQGVLQRGAPMRVRCPLRQHAFPLQLKRLTQTLALRILRMSNRWV